MERRLAALRRNYRGKRARGDGTCIRRLRKGFLELGGATTCLVRLNTYTRQGVSPPSTSHLLSISYKDLDNRVL